MTATMERPAPTAQVREPASKLTLAGVLRSEWIKLKSVRSSLFTLGGAAFVMLLAAGLFSVISTSSSGDGDTGGPGGGFAGSPVGAVLGGSTIAALIIAVLGVLVASNEYSTGMIRASLTAVPTRVPVLVGKIVAVVLAVFPVMLAVSFAAFYGGMAILSANDATTAALGDPGVLRAVVGTAVYLTGIALLGTALGTVLRGTAGAITTVFGLLFLVPGLGQLLLPSDWQDDVLKFLPSNAGSSFTSVVPDPTALSPTAGAIVFAAWVLVPLVAAGALLKRRDA
jgi:ABC-type transport system involved in multi-copper enzyme maturation permease subunit